MFDLTSKQIVVMGGRGFLGTHLVKKLKEHGATKVIPLAHHDYELRDRAQVQQMFDDLHPEVIIHLAAAVGGIGANRSHPGSFFYDIADISSISEVVDWKPIISKEKGVRMMLDWLVKERRI